MTTRELRTSVVFRRPFRLKGIDQPIAAGRYDIVTDEELIEGLSHLAWRRVSTMIFLLTPSWFEMIAIDPADLQGALDRDALPQDPALPGAAVKLAQTCLR